MISNPPFVTLTVTLSENHAWHLAQFLKRISYATVERYSDTTEKDQPVYMMESLAALKKALAEKGISPR